jgi:rhodanese-related sulfurtransferase
VTERQTIGQLLEAARARLERLDPEEAHQALLDGALLIDTRSQDLRHAAGVIPGSVHIPLSVLYWRLDPSSESRNPDIADLDRRVILICAHGFSSSLAAATLQQLGFRKATDVAGGFEGWATAGLPVEQLPPDKAI